MEDELTREERPRTTLAGTSAEPEQNPTEQ